MGVVFLIALLSKASAFSPSSLAPPGIHSRPVASFHCCPLLVRPAFNPRTVCLPSVFGPVRPPSNLLGNCRRMAESKPGSILDASASGTGGSQYKDREGVEGREGKLYSGPAERNTGPILDILKRIVPTAPGRVLAIAEGSGQHVTAFAAEFGHLRFLPTEIEDTALKSIQAYTEDAGLSNVEAPVLFDVVDPDWDAVTKGGAYDVLYVVNLCHIAPWAATEGLMAAAARLLKPSGTLLVYGPFKVDGGFSSEGNKGFDERLRQRNPEWGYRDVKEVQDAGAAKGLAFKEAVEVHPIRVLAAMNTPIAVPTN